MPDARSKLGLEGWDSEPWSWALGLVSAHLKYLHSIQHTGEAGNPFRNGKEKEVLDCRSDMV